MTHRTKPCVTWSEFSFDPALSWKWNYGPPGVPSSLSDAVMVPLRATACSRLRSVLPSLPLDMLVIGVNPVLPQPLHIP